MWKKIAGQVIDINTRKVIETPTEEQQPTPDDYDRFKESITNIINEGGMCHFGVKGCGFNKGYIQDEQHPELSHPDCPVHGSGGAMDRHPSAKGRLKLVTDKESNVQVHDVTDTGTSTEDLNTPEWDAKLRNADLYSKSAVIKAEKLTEDTPLTTTLADGHVETSRTAPAGHYLVTNPGGEQYAVDPETFEKKYEPHPTDEGVYLPKGAPTPAVKIDKDMDITAPWGEAQHMRAGDYILGQPDSTDRYGIGQKEFKDTYGLHTLQYNVAHTRNSRVMSNEFNERISSTSEGLWIDEEDFEKVGAGEFDPLQRHIEETQDSNPNMAKNWEEAYMKFPPGNCLTCGNSNNSPTDKFCSETCKTRMDLIQSNLKSDNSLGGKDSVSTRFPHTDPLLNKDSENYDPSSYAELETGVNVIHSSISKSLPEWIKNAIKEAHPMTGDPEADAEEMALEGTREKGLPHDNSFMVSCPDCGGSGVDERPGHDGERCHGACQGKGKVLDPALTDSMREPDDLEEFGLNEAFEDREF